MSPRMISPLFKKKEFLLGINTLGFIPTPKAKETINHLRWNLHQQAYLPPFNNSLNLLFLSGSCFFVLWWWCLSWVLFPFLICKIQDTVVSLWLITRVLRFFRKICIDRDQRASFQRAKVWNSVSVFLMSFLVHNSQHCPTKLIMFLHP